MQNKSKKKLLTALLSAIILILLISISFFSTTFNKGTDTKKTRDEVSSAAKKTDFAKMTESDIKPSNEKLNIYVFWGDGCPHCKHLSEFLREHNSEIKNLANLYTFEVWNSSENLTFMKNFGKFLGETPKGVPYFIIGNKTFSGFSESDKKTKKQILETIKTEAAKDNKVDKYQDYIKHNKIKGVAQ